MHMHVILCSMYALIYAFMGTLDGTASPCTPPRACLYPCWCAPHTQTYGPYDQRPDDQTTDDCHDCQTVCTLSMTVCVQHYASYTDVYITLTLTLTLTLTRTLTLTLSYDCILQEVSKKCEEVPLEVVCLFKCPPKG